MIPSSPQLPLNGKTIIWTGSDHAGASLIRALRQSGAAVERHPLIRIAPPQEGAPIWPTDSEPDRYAWILFTSQAAADTVRGRPKPEARIGAVGPKTKDRLTALGWTVDLVPDTHHAGALAEALLQRGRPRKPLLFVRGDRAQKTLVTRLTQHGMPVEEIVVYTTVPVSLDKARTTADRIAEAAHAVILASPSGAETLAAALAPRPLAELKPGILWLCLGPATSNALKWAGVPDAIHPPTVTPEALVRTAVSALIP